MKLIWRWRTHTHTPSIITSASNSSAPSTTASNVNLTEKIKTAVPEEVPITEEKLVVSESATVSPQKKSWSWGWRLSPKKSSADASDAEKGNNTRQTRPIRLFAPLYVGAGAGLALCEYRLLFFWWLLNWLLVVFIACGLVFPLQEWKLDHQYYHFILLVTVPLLTCISLVSILPCREMYERSNHSKIQFFALQIITNISMMYAFSPLLPALLTDSLRSRQDWTHCPISRKLAVLLCCETSSKPRSRHAIAPCNRWNACIQRKPWRNYVGPFISGTVPH